MAEASCPCPAPALRSAEEEANNGDIISLFRGEQGCHGRTAAQGPRAPRGPPERLAALSLQGRNRAHKETATRENNPGGHGGDLCIPPAATQPNEGQDLTHSRRVGSGPWPVSYSALFTRSFHKSESCSVVSNSLHAHGLTVQSMEFPRPEYWSG